MREKYESLSVATLRSLAKARNMRHISTLKKSELIDAMLAQDELDAQAKTLEETAGAPKPPEPQADLQTGEAVPQQSRQTGEAVPQQSRQTGEAVPQRSRQTGEASPQRARQAEESSPQRARQAEESSMQRARQAEESAPQRARQTEETVLQRARQTEESVPQRTRQTEEAVPQRARQTGEAAPQRSRQTGGSAPQRNRRTEEGAAPQRTRRTEEGPAPQRVRRMEGSSSQRSRQTEGTAPAQRYQRTEDTAPAQRYQRTEDAAPAQRYQRTEDTAPAQRYQRTEDTAPAQRYQRTEDAASTQRYQRTEDAAPAQRYQRTEDTAPVQRYQRMDEGIAQDTAGSLRETAPRSQNRDQLRDGGAERTAGRESGRESSDRPPMDLASLDSGNCVSGILEVLADGYGFLRSDNYLPGENDVYVAPSQIRRFNLKTGDIVTGNTRVRAQQEKYSALLYILSVNGFSPSEVAKRPNFEDMTPIFPNERLRLERGGRDMAMRIVDLLSPVGKGQRGMIVSPPKAGKTTLLKDVATSILQNNPEMHILIMLIDERPEEVTDIREAIVGDNVEVLYSTFDELPEHHKRVSEMGIERAKRLVEQGQDVIILLDSITRLARAYNLTVAPSGRTLSGGLDPAALNMPKRFFGAARNMREGGSLTILATALVDTGSKMDDVVYEEFKGTGNMELVLDRKLSERRVFPAIDILKSGTRREDLLLEPEELEAVYIMRKALNGMRSEEAVENILNMFYHSRNNAELIAKIRRLRII